jgi:hypothetical protein
MRLEIFVLGLTAFFIYNAYNDGKYTKMLLTFKKYYKMIFYALLGIGIYALLKRNPSQGRNMLLYANNVVKFMPIDKTSVAKTYYRDIHSEYRDKLTTLMNMRLVIDTLTQKGYPFIMTYMDDLTFDTQWHVTPAVLELQDYVRPHMTQFEGKSFLEWSRSQGYPETEKWHPLEAAHCAAADYILQNSINKSILNKI